MTDTRTRLEDHGITAQHVRYAAAGLAFLVAAVHLFHPAHGLPRFAEIVAVGLDNLMYDPRPIAFVLSGVTIILGVNLVAVGASRRLLYALGMAMMVVYLVGYFGWHLSGHGGFLPVRKPLYHDMGPIEATAAHLRGDPWARVSVLAETALLAVLAWLYRNDR